MILLQDDVHTCEQVMRNCYQSKLQTWALDSLTLTDKDPGDDLLVAEWVEEKQEWDESEHDCEGSCQDGPRQDKAGPML